jgi:hypothetical protein
MSKEKWKRRDMKLHKKKAGMRVSGRSVFTLQEILRRRAEIARRENDKKGSDSQSGDE